MKRISSNVQLLLSASNQINNHNRAVEELVYNALDAGATSIAVRINVHENTIQVIDNGCGVSCEDLNFMGQKHMTSKHTNISTLKSVNQKYGFRGQALANIINVSKSVKVTSRYENSEETMTKLFEYGTEKKIYKCTSRPSKGTTIEITGFLYNLDIQKKSKDTLGDLQSIKTFLENLSLVHCNVSISLRDESKNEVIFQIHKNRNFYQTLSTLYKMDKNNIQELQVEKSEYKVTAYIGKSDEIGKHLIFLNGKFILNSSKLHKIADSNLSKHFKLRGLHKSKMKNLITEEESIWNQKKIPDYFIFIKCPRMDYDISNSPKQSVLEFKNWNQINKMLEKLINFFNGDINLKIGNDLDRNQACNVPEHSDTRKKVKLIMEKILGTHPNKPEISHMHNAIKGRQAKRKIKKLSLKQTKKGNINKKYTDNNNIAIKNAVTRNDLTNSHKTNESRNKNLITQKNSRNVTTKSSLGTNVKEVFSKKCKSKFKKTSENKKLNTSHRINADENTVIKRQFINNLKHDSNKKCYDVQEKIVNKKHPMNNKAFIRFLNENIVLNNNVPKTHFNISVRKQIDEIIIHHNSTKNPVNNLDKKSSAREIVKKKLVKSNYDLLETIIKSQRERTLEIRNVADDLNNTVTIMNPPKTDRVVSIAKTNEPINIDPDINFIEPMITYNSHNYYLRHSYDVNNENNIYHVKIHNENRRRDNYNRPRTFITEHSKDNFLLPNNSLNNNFKKKKLKSRLSKHFRSHIKTLFKQTSKLLKLKKQILGSMSESSYAIEFTESNNCRYETNTLGKDASGHIMTCSQTNYATCDKNDQFGYNKNWALHATYTVEKTDHVITNTESQNPDYSIDDNQDKRNFIFVSKSLEHDQNQQTLNPLDICETVFHSEEILNREFGRSFNDKQSELPINSNDFRDDYVDYKDCVHSKENVEVSEERYLNDQKIHNEDSTHECSHHFSSNKSVNNQVKKLNENMKLNPIISISRQSDKIIKEINKKQNISTLETESKHKFNYIDRPCFVPKGMSPIFQNCQTKNASEYNLSKDYYDKEIYKNFADGVRSNAEIFEPTIKDANENTTKTLNKINYKIIEQSSSLKFDGQSLKDAKVKTSIKKVEILGQIYDKFIAATIKERHSDESSDYLVLFDQHAVHERIRLENNLADYFNENKWKGLEINPVTLSLSKDNTLYLHNFQNKFERLGLQWSVSRDDKMSITSIPEAILGKNPRQVEKVMEAVKNLISEEINVMKIQGGCVSLYPKSIMDLVFSEACRYAIKFGDKLSKSECAQLLKELSACKTPFQCAHGRPVMAVLMKIELKRVNYKINLDKLMEWKRKLST